MKNSTKGLIIFLLVISCYIAFIICKYIIGFTEVDALLGWIFAIIWISISCLGDYFRMRRVEKEELVKEIVVKMTKEK